MKKTLLAAVLAVAALGASAGELTGSVKYDYDRFESTTPWVSGHRVTTGLKYDFGGYIGAVDGGFVAAQAVVGGNRINANGYDVGYSNGFKVGNVAIGGRVGYTQLNAGRIQNVGSLQAEIVSLAATVAVSLTDKVTLVGGAEHLGGDLDGALSGSATANRYTVGAKVALTKSLALTATYARTRAEGENANGLTTALSYAF